MINKLITKRNRKAAIEKVAGQKLDEAIKLLDESEYGSEEYYKHLAQVDKLNQTMKSDKKFKLDSNVTTALITSAAGIAGTWLILTYEQDGIVNSKAANITSKWLGR